MVGTRRRAGSATGAAAPALRLAAGGAPPLNEVAYRRIRAAIQAGAIARGDVLSEGGLARGLGISRTPVREAIKRLAVEGLVEVFPRRGTFLSVPDAGQLREIFQLREALEGMAARLAAPRAPRAEADRFRARLEAAHRAGDAAAVFQTGRELHEWIVAESGNRRLAEYLAALRSQIHAGFRMGVRLEGQMARSYREYRALLGALRRRDAAGAERAMRRHIEGVQSRLLGG